MKLKLEEGDRIVLAGYEVDKLTNVDGKTVLETTREPAQRGTIEKIEDINITVRISDDIVRIVTIDEVKSRIIDEQVKCGKCYSTDLADTGAGLVCKSCGWRFTHTS